VANQPFYTDGSFTVNTPSVTSYLCTDGAFQIYEGVALAFLWGYPDQPLEFPDFVPVAEDGVLTNAEVLAVDQNSKENQQALMDGDLVIWTARSESGNGFYVAVFNTGDSELSVDRSWREVGLEKETYHVRDLWQKKNVGGANRLTVKLAPHASIIWSLQ